MRLRRWQRPGGNVGLGDYRVEIALGCIALITVINLRGVKESGMIFSVPTYVFIVSIVLMIGLGFYRVAIGGWVAAAPQLAETAAAVEPLSIFLILRAFAAGCTALTGVEAISNGVPAFKPPESRNASTTLIWMIATLGVMFLGISVLAYFIGAVPREDVSVISQIAIQIVGTGPAFFVI